MYACHSKGIIHRDLKLENVLFENENMDRLKVADFGIAGICKGDEGEKTESGTLFYMPPEVIYSS
jgi:calcium-dependent protein kinase